MKQRLTEKGADLSRPYEKCLMYGASALTDAELIAVILRCGTKGKDAVALADSILKLSPVRDGVGGLASLSSADYMEVEGIGEVKAIQLECVGELSKRISQATARKSVSLSEPETLANYFMESLRHENQENVLCVMLDAKLRIIGEERITRGSATMSVISPRDIFMAAIRHRAVSIALIHNHPSGDPTPSPADLEMTERVCEAGRLLEIRLIDHIIIGDMCYMSFLENGYIDAGSLYAE